MNTQEIRLDLDKRVTVAERVVIGQGDKGGTTIVAHIFDHGVAYDLTGKSAMFEMRIPKQTEYVRDNCTVSGNTITYIVDEEHAAAAYGTTDCAYFDILIGDSVIASTARFTIDILRSARDGAEPAQSWDTEIDELIQRGEQAVSDAEQAVGDATSAIDAANQAIARIEPTIEEAAEEAAEQATADAEQRIQDAIDAMGDISELAVPLMSADVRGGAKLEEHGGLALRDGALGIGSLVQQSDGYARGGLAEVTAKGHAEQVATTGKNLAVPYSTATVSNGVTVTPQQDGSVILSGTSTDTFIRLVPPSVHISAGVAYTASIGDYSGTPITNYGIAGYGTSKTVTPSSDFNGAGINIIVPSGGVFNSIRLYPQLELGSTATEYEPYTGGEPSPSPDYAQEIQVVRGRNLVDESASVWRVGGFNGITGEESTSTNRMTTTSANAFDVVGGQTYVITTASTHKAQAYFYNGTTFISSAGDNFTTPTHQTVITAPSNATKAKILLGRTDNANMSTSDLSNAHVQLTLGSTPQPYVPFGYVGMEVRASTGNWEQGAVNSPSSARETYSALKASNAKRIRTAELVPLVIGDDYFVTVASGYECVVQAFSDDGRATVPIPTYANAWKSSSFAFKATTPFIAVAVRYANQDDIHVSEETLNACRIVHTTTPIPLPPRGWVAGLPDGTADELRLDGAGKCEWTETIWKAVFDGSEPWGNGDSGTANNRYDKKLPDMGLPARRIDNNSLNIIANSHRAVGSNGNSAPWGVINIRNDQFVLFFDSGNVHTLASFKSWLSTHPVTVLYPLATPVTEDCGYVDMPAIPSDATVTIPELDALGIRYFVDDAVTQYGREIYARVCSEYADRITALEQAVAELVTS